MIDKKEFKNLSELFFYLEQLDKNWVYFLWEFLCEIDESNDELMIILDINWITNVFSCIHSNQEELPHFWKIFYACHIFENEIYDFYWKSTNWTDNFSLRLHLFESNYFPLRKKWKALVDNKNPFKFMKVSWEWIVTVPVWPIHAWIIPPWHFRFSVDWEDIINLDIQLWWKYRWIDKYFNEEKNLQKLLLCSQEIAWDSCVSYWRWFVKNIENCLKIKVDDETIKNRIIMLELERIYNHLWTIWALANDVWQAFILNSCLSLRELILELNNTIYWHRLLKQSINIWFNNKNLNKQDVEKIKQTFSYFTKRLETIVDIEQFSTWIYDRFKDTGIVKNKTALKHSWLWIVWKASWIQIDYRKYDENYIKNVKNFEIIVWENWDSFDRFIVRANEINQSVNIILNLIDKLNFTNSSKSINTSINLNDWLYVSRTEWHRWEILQILVVKNWKIDFYKFKDPSFVNRTLLEYAVLNNIIADFPICNKSFDLSYSWFDM